MSTETKEYITLDNKVIGAEGVPVSAGEVVHLTDKQADNLVNKVKLVESEAELKPDETESEAEVEVTDDSIEPKPAKKGKGKGKGKK